MLNAVAGKEINMLKIKEMPVYERPYEKLEKYEQYLAEKQKYDEKYDKYLQYLADLEEYNKEVEKYEVYIYIK